MSDAAFEQQMKEIRRMIHYLFMISGGKSNHSMMKWNEGEEYHFDWYEVKSHIPCPDEDVNGNPMYGHVDSTILNLSNNTLHYTIKHSYDIERNQYPTIELKDFPKLVDAIQKHLMGYVFAKAKEQAILRIQKEELDKVLTGKYERLEHWK